jgi:tRNA(His) 5'-end guanylyltransferase
MKRYEASAKAFLPRRTYTIVRVDGKAFHSYLRNADKPFDSDFMCAMDQVTRFLCRELQGSVFAYTQSDEISVLLQDFESVQTEPWFGGNVQKMASIAASLATAKFNWFMGGLNVVRESEFGVMAMFDARVFTIPDPVEVANYFVWRQRDAVRTSISMAAQAAFPHAELQGLNGDQLQEKLWREKGVNWNEECVRAKRGAVCVKVSYQEGDEIRSKWELRDPPSFAALPGDFLAEIIPELPSFKV